MRRRWKWLAGGLAGLLLAALGAGVLVLRSDWFREQVRRKLIEVTEQATGGRVELVRFHYDWDAMTARVEGFTLQGLEGEAREPLVRIPELTLAIHIRSLVRQDVELRRLVVVRPAVHVYVDEEGNTNLPKPRRSESKTNVIEDLLRLRVGQLEVQDGRAHYDSRVIPLEARAEGVGVRLTLANVERLDYELKVARFDAGPEKGLVLEARGALEAQRVTVETARVIRQGTRLELSGTVEDFKAPRVAGEARVSGPVAEWPELVLAGGTARGVAKFTWSEAEGLRARGQVSGEGLRLALEDFAVDGARLATEYALQGDELDLTGTRLEALGGAWQGTVRMRGWERLELAGEAANLSVRRIMAAVRQPEFPWEARLSGPLSFTTRVGSGGLTGSVARGAIRVAPVEGEVAVGGEVGAEWRQAANQVVIEMAQLTTASSRLNVTGVLGERVEAGLFTTHPQDLEPVLALITGEPVAIPLTLRGGSLQVQAVVEGSLETPRLEGDVKVTQAHWEDLTLTEAAGHFRLNEAELRVDRLNLLQNGGRLQGRVRLGLKEWKLPADAALEAALQVRALRLSEVARLTGFKMALDGTLDATLEAAGTLDQPRGSVQWQARQVVIGEERFSRLSGRLKAGSGETLRLDGDVSLDAAIVALNASYRHPAGDWRNGEGAVRLKSKGFRLAQSEMIHQQRAGLDAALTLEGEAAVKVTNGQVQLRRLDGFVALDSIRDRQRDLGAMRLESRTAQAGLEVALSGKVDGTPLMGSATVGLDRRYPARGSLRLEKLPLASIADWAGEGAPRLEGALDARLDWRGNLAEPERLSATLTIPRFEVSPPGQGTTATDFTLRNAGPLQMDIDREGLQVRSVRLVAKETSITVAGVYSFQSRTPWDLSLSGRINLGVLSSIEPDLQGTGVAQISANLRGAAGDPQVSGRMAIQDASLYLRGVSNGVEKANGTIYFDRDRASIESLTAVTGGGTVALGGFVGFGRGEWSYRLQAKAKDVRVRYPEGVSTTVDADLSLTGSQNASLLSGLVTVQRSGFSSRGDFASLVAGSGNPIPVPATQNELLRNLQFDVRVRTSPNATFQTDYTQDLQTEADLRVRGSLAKPVILGSVMVNQGEINFFGNRYTISRGEVLFYNTATIQPSINLDLETRIRGVVVYIGVSGPLARLNVNYRSEPPLQSREILALLTVGRAPTATSTGLQGQGLNPPAQQSGAGTNMLAEASNTLLGGALSASVSSRVEKFFGVSRIKIDPNVTGVENIPQARLTIEQSLSRDITLTFSSNLSRSSQQIIRLEWDLSRQWSAIAVRDENGAFGVDFLYRKRFK